MDNQKSNSQEDLMEKALHEMESQGGIEYDAQA